VLFRNLIFFFACFLAISILTIKNASIAYSQFLESSPKYDFENPGVFTMPAAIAYDSFRHRIAVSDKGSNLINIYDLSDGSLEVLGREYEIQQPLGLCFGPKGELYVAMLNSPYILQYQFDRIFPDTITLQLEENFKFNYPAHITIDKKERFFIVDRENSDILIADFKGFIVKVIQDKLRNPNGIYISANNDIYV